MSSYSKEATANLELDKAWERYLANSDDLSKILKNIELLAKTAKTTIDGIYEIKYSGNAQELAQKYMKAKVNGLATYLPFLEDPNIRRRYFLPCFHPLKRANNILHHRLLSDARGLNFLRLSFLIR